VSCFSDSFYKLNFFCSENKSNFASPVNVSLDLRIYRYLYWKTRQKYLFIYFLQCNSWKCIDLLYTDWRFSAFKAQLLTCGKKNCVLRVKEQKGQRSCVFIVSSCTFSSSSKCVMIYDGSLQQDVW